MLTSFLNLIPFRYHEMSRTLYEDLDTARRIELRKQRDRAKVGDRLFLRFVPTERGEIARNTLSCLRMITCAEDSPRNLPADLAAGTAQHSGHTHCAPFELGASHRPL